MASADSTWNGYIPAQACDDNPGTDWRCWNGYPNWWKYDFGVGVTRVVTTITIRPYETNALKNFLFQGSNNDVDWDTLYTGECPSAEAVHFFSFANTTAYRYYRIYITSNWRGNTWTGIDEVEFMEGEPVYICPYCETPFASQIDLDAHIAIAHPIGEWKATQINAPYKIAWNFGSPTDAKMTRLVEGGFNLVQMYDNYYRGTKAYRDECSRLAIKYQIGLMPFPGWYGSNSYPAQRMFQERRADPAVWGWQIGEEPKSTGVTITNLKNTYTQMKSYNPEWKGFVAHGDDEWSRHGYAVGGTCDVFGTDIYPCIKADPAGYIKAKVVGLDYDHGTRSMIDNYGAEHCPVIMAWAYSQWTTPEGIRVQYDAWKEVIDRGLPSGLAYYLTSGFLPEAGGDVNLWAKIVAMNQQIGGQTGIIPRPPEEITTETITHSCAATIGYQVSSWGENNNPLTCPHCGLALEQEGIKRSEEIIDVPEVITPVIVTCSKCGSKLELSVSSLANKNIQQYCPVCGEAAD